MTKTIVLAAAALAALAITGAAAASKKINLAPGHCTKVKGELVCAKPLRTSKAYTTMKTSLAASQQHAATLQATVASQQGTISSEQTQIASLAAQIAAIPSPLQVAVNDVRDEATWAGATPQDFALAAMDYTIGHVRTGMYGYLEGVYGETPGGPDLPSYYADVNTILGTQTGICLHAERVFGAIMEALGYQVRDVGFDYVEPNGSPDAHSTAEVYYNGGWHFFDPTFGQYWKDASGNVLSIADVRAGQGTLVRDSAAFVNVIEDASSPNGIDTWFETAPATTVYYAAQP